MATDNDPRYLIELKNYNQLPKVFPGAEKCVNDIMTQYNDCIGGKSNNMISEAMYILKLRRQWTIVSSIVVVLAVKKQNELIELVNKYYKFDNSNEQKYFESLVNIEKQLQGLMSKIQIKQSDFDKKYNKKIENPINTYNSLAILTEYYNTAFDARQLSVKYYLELCKVMKDGINEQKKQIDNGKRKTRN